MMTRELDWLYSKVLLLLLKNESALIMPYTYKRFTKSYIMNYTNSYEM